MEPSILDHLQERFQDPLRFAACIIRFKKLSVLFVTVYLWCSEGLTERNNEILLYIYMLAALVNLPLICIGDFNITAQEFLESGWANKFQATIMQPNTPTIVSSSAYRPIDFGFISDCPPEVGYVTGGSSSSSFSKMVW